MSMKIRGVNLGNWFCLEKWIKPELLDGCDELDELGFVTAMPEESRKRLEEHYRTYITEKDFSFMAEEGVNLVRIPVNYTVFGDVEGRVGHIEQLDLAFAWAEKYNMKILLDLHTVKGGQNGFDNSGCCALCTWHKHPEYVEETYQLLEKLARRYADSPALFGIEPLNEPATEDIIAANIGRYGSKYPERAAQSEAVPDEFLKEFYLEVYRRLKPILPEHAVIVLSDQFNLSKWENFMPKDQYPGVWLDGHKYICFSEGMLEQGENGYAAVGEQIQSDAELRIPGQDESGYASAGAQVQTNAELKKYLELVKEGFLKDIQQAAQFHPVMVGEWGIVNHMNSIQNAANEKEAASYYRALADAQIAAWETCEGGVFWTYRLDNEEEDDAWDFRTCVKNGWLSYR